MYSLISGRIFDEFKLAEFACLVLLYTAGYNTYRRHQKSEASESKRVIKILVF